MQIGFVDSTVYSSTKEISIISGDRAIISPSAFVGSGVLYGTYFSPTLPSFTTPSAIGLSDLLTLESGGGQPVVSANGDPGSFVTRQSDTVVFEWDMNIDADNKWRLVLNTDTCPTPPKIAPTREEVFERYGKGLCGGHLIEVDCVDPST